MPWLGVGVVLDGKLVAGASSYSVYCGGIEIQIETHSAYRRKGLCHGLWCGVDSGLLGPGRYPSWDAHDLRSVALAEKLGYRRGTHIGSMFCGMIRKSNWQGADPKIQF